MDERKLVSIIIPVYNCSDYIPCSVGSASQQSYPMIEVIIVDDGSTDNSGEVCDRLAELDGRIRVFHTPNQGAAGARNFGLAKASGKYILFLDADDYLETNGVEVLVQAMENSGSDIVIGSFFKVDTEGKVSAAARDFPAGKLLTVQEVVEYALEYLDNPRKNQMLMTAWGKLFRTSIIHDNTVLFRTDLKIAEDVAFNFTYLRYIKAAFFLADVVYYHRKHPGYRSLSMKLGDNPEDMFGYLKALEDVRSFLIKLAPTIDVEKYIGQCYIYQVTIFIIRVCGQVNDANRETVVHYIKSLVGSAPFRKYIEIYRPAAGNYQLIPLLMRYRLVTPLMFFCRKEARHIYGATD